MYTVYIYTPAALSVIMIMTKVIIVSVACGGDGSSDQEKVISDRKTEKVDENNEKLLAKQTIFLSEEGRKIIGEIEIIFFRVVGKKYTIENTNELRMIP